MNRLLLEISLLTTFLVLPGGDSLARAQAQDRRTGTIVGEVKSKKDSNNGKNVTLEVLAPGEEKPRPYFVQFDPKLKGPMPEVLKAVRASQVGDRVEFDWEATNHGPAITKFKVLKKAAGEKP